MWTSSTARVHGTAVPLLTCMATAALHPPGPATTATSSVGPFAGTDDGSTDVGVALPVTHRVVTWASTAWCDPGLNQLFVRGAGSQVDHG